eukprot:jgi/Mesen1/2242/ME000153S01465
MVLLELPPVNNLNGSQNGCGSPSHSRSHRSVRCRVGPEVLVSLKHIEHLKNTGLETIWVAAFGTLLYRYNPGNKNVSIGVPMSLSENGYVNGHTTGLQKPAQFKSVQLHFETDTKNRTISNGSNGVHGVHHNTTFSEVLSQVKAQTFAQAFPAATPEDNLEAFFSYDEVTKEQEPTRVTPSDYSLFLRLVLASDGALEVELEFLASSFDKGAASRLAHSFLRLLMSLSSSSDAMKLPVSSLTILSGHEEEAVLGEFSRRQIRRALDGQAVDETLVDIIERQARACPEETAVVDKYGMLTYHELVTRAREVATYLLVAAERRGRSKDHHEGGGSKALVSPPLVGMGLDRCREWVVAMVGIMMAGMGYCPLDPSHPRARIQELVEQTSVKVVLTTRESSSLFSWLNQDLKVEVTLVEDLKGAHRVDLRALEGARPSGSSVCYVLFTSGSTGKPKGVVVEHQGVRNMVHAFRHVLPRETPDIRGQLCAMTFDLHAMDVFCAFDVGGTVAICDKEELLTDLSGFVRRQGVRGMVITPTVAALLEPSDVPSLRWLAFGGEAVPRALILKWIGAGRTVIDHYGPTECSVAAACQVWRPGDQVADHIGRPLDGAHIYVLGPDLELLPVGVPGELCISGCHVSQGYLKRPDLTEKVFKSNPYSIGPHDRQLYKTGDRCRWLPDGNIQFLGRIDFQVKIRGNRVEPGEIEDRISRVDGVARCVVVLREDEPGAQYLVAYMMIQPKQASAAGGVPTTAATTTAVGAVTGTTGQAAAAGARAGVAASAGGERGDAEGVCKRVREALVAQLPAYMVPAAYVVLDQLPQTMSGKVDRKQLPKPGRESFLAEGGAGEAQEACRTEEERVVAEVFAEVLGLAGDSLLPTGGPPGAGAGVFRTSNFFELGGNSFSASQAVAHVQQAFGLSPSTLTIRAFFEAPTVAAVAAVLEREQRAAYLRPDDAQRALVQQHVTSSAAKHHKSKQHPGPHSPSHLLPPHLQPHSPSQPHPHGGGGGGGARLASLGGGGSKGRNGTYGPTSPGVGEARSPGGGLGASSGSRLTRAYSKKVDTTEREREREVERHSQVSAHVPLSHAQEVMWLVRHIVPNPEVMEMCDVWQVQGEIDAERLQATLQMLLARHQALRMRFVVDRSAIGAHFLSTVLKRWGTTASSPAGAASGLTRVTTALAGVLGPVFLRNMHSLFSFVDQIVQDPTVVPFKLEIVDLRDQQSQLPQQQQRRSEDGHSGRAANGVANGGSHSSHGTGSGSTSAKSYGAGSGSSNRYVGSEGRKGSNGSSGGGGKEGGHGYGHGGVGGSGSSGRSKSSSRRESEWELRQAVEHARRPFDMQASVGLLFRATLIHLSAPAATAAPSPPPSSSSFSHSSTHPSPPPSGADGAVNGRGPSEESVRTATAAGGSGVGSSSTSGGHVFNSGSLAGLPEATDYADYVSWERDWLAAGAEATEVAYWKRLLGKDPEQLQLAPAPRKPLVAVPCRGAWLEFSIDSHTRAALEQVAHSRGATLNMGMLAAFLTLLHLWSNQRRIIVGTLVARRPLGAHQSMVGHVADITPIVADFHPSREQEGAQASRTPSRSHSQPQPQPQQHAYGAQLSRSFGAGTGAATGAAAAAVGGAASVEFGFVDVLLQVRERVLEALENQSVTLRMIVSEVLSQPDFARSALIQAYFSYLQPGTNASPEGLRLGGARAEYDLAASWAHEGEAALTPVSMLLRQQRDGSVRGRLVYQADLFDRAMIEAMTLQYQLVVKGACKVPLHAL